MKRILAIALFAALAWTQARAADISGAGATFPYPIYAKWADAYKKETGIGLNYQSIGSGGGIKQIKAKTVTFGASDMPLKPDDLEASGLIQFPMIMGGTVPVVNLQGIAPGQLTLDGKTAGRHLPRRHHQVERPEDQGAQSRRQPAEQGDRRGASLRRLGHDLPVHQLSLGRRAPIGRARSAPTRGRMAGRHRRQGQ